MQTQRDHVHAHQFQMARMSSALLLGDPSMAENPMRRTLLGVAGGAIVALLVIVSFGIYGWIVPGGNSGWRKGGVIVVEKETGTRYVVLGGRLYPPLNLASAMILNGGPAMQLVSRNSLGDTPRGGPIGIPGAPQVLPESASGLVAGPWLACPDASGQVGLDLDPAAPAAGLSPTRFALVRAGGADYLIWEGRKHRIGDPSIPVALGATSAVPVDAPAAWIAMVPAGDDLTVPSIPGSGATATIGGHRAAVGDLFAQKTAGGTQLFVLRRDGLAPINRTMALLLSAANGTEPVTLDAASIAAAPRSADRTLTTPFAGLADASVTPDGLVVCLRQGPSGKTTVSGEVVVTASGLAPFDGKGDATVRLKSGTAMVVTPVPAAATDRYLIAEQGKRYHLNDATAAKALGIPDNYQVPFPRTFLDSLAAGPALTRAAIVTEPEG